MTFLFDTSVARAEIAAEQERTRPRSRAETLVDVVREDSSLTVAELAKASERSPAWVRKTLKAAGLTAAKPTKPARISVTSKSRCTCGHEKKAHCSGGEGHGDGKGGWYTCQSLHCLWGWKSGPDQCSCNNFVDAGTGIAAVWRQPLPKPQPETLCKKCGHEKQYHCSRGVLGFRFDEGNIHRVGINLKGCQHWQQKRNSICTSTSCAVLVGPEGTTLAAAEFCPCQKFVSPFTRKMP
jgi:hypothetical protein